MSHEFYYSLCHRMRFCNGLEIGFTQNDITSSATVLQAIGSSLIGSFVLLDFTSYYIRQRAGPLLEVDLAVLY